jgi:hypothetical protein
LTSNVFDIDLHQSKFGEAFALHLFS